MKSIDQQLADANRLMKKICHRCGEEFEVKAYFAAMDAFSRCNREECNKLAWNGFKYVKENGGQTNDQ